ncbi:hypothetical protein LTR66_011322 [Elasticomyces elasticus]|nr:hypothetical protein LTR66_011322 [Elasticomyces elasticus]
MTAPDVNATVPEAVASASKPKRVRTGCLTCRERHLKCDEGLPNCQNCRKSSRVCKRGVRLNFIDTQVQSPPYVPQSRDWKVSFLDESREIASEYKGGLDKYGMVTPEPEPVVQVIPADNTMNFSFSTSGPPAPTLSHQALPPINGMLQDGHQEGAQGSMYNQPEVKFLSNTDSATNSPFSGPNLTHGSSTTYGPTEPDLDPDNEKREFLNSQEEVLFMQVFVEEVGLWMDSMDPMKHFSRLLPFHSLQEPMLLNAFLACGARHLTLVNPAYTEEKALHYYDTATRYLLKSLQNPNRDTVICATTAVILNVYEIMNERALQRMNHIAGARALIKECGWNARASGIGAACFWLNVGMEILSCLHFNWQVAWDPDDWGVDMDFSRELHNGREEVWTHRTLYIVAKVANFRATIPRYQESDPRDEALRTQNRYTEWQRLKDWADAWNDNIPRTMHPMAYLYPYQTTSKSAFPEVWLIKRTTIVARLFYHTAMCLLAQIHPYLSKDIEEMHEMQLRHSQMICGIAAHVKDRGVASVALRSLAHAAECLTDRREQEEVLQIFEKIHKETGWRISFVFKELREKWGWEDESQRQAVPPLAPQQQQQRQQQLNIQSSLLQNPQILPTSFQYQPMQQQQQQMTTALPPAPPQTQPAVPARPKVPAGIPNPMYATADFSLPQHPYQNVYVAPAAPHHSHLYY